MSAPIDLDLLPRSARLDASGRVSIGDVDLAGLADFYGTPLYVYDESELRARCRAYRDNFTGGVAYASKAFLCIAMAAIVAEEGLSIDVATGGELFVARHAGFPPDRIEMHGNNKSESELQFALETGVGRIIVDSFDELDRLESLARHARVVPEGACPGDAGCPRAYARAHRNRRRRLEVRLQPRQRRRARRRGARP